jgi:hypothetical protein
MFAVRQHKNARQTIFLPSVFCRAPWKICTATEKIRTAKIETHGKHLFSRSDL